MRFFLMIAIFAMAANGEINTNPPKRVSACIINANEQYINACINGVRYALEAELADTLYNEYKLTPIFVGTDYSKCTCNMERVIKRVTQRRTELKMVTEYDPTKWGTIRLLKVTPTEKAKKQLRAQEAKPPKLKTSIVCVKC